MPADAAKNVATTGIRHPNCISFPTARKLNLPGQQPAKRSYVGLRNAVLTANWSLALATARNLLNWLGERIIAPLTSVILSVDDEKKSAGSPTTLVGELMAVLLRARNQTQ
jgi:hypothetical protein